MAKKSVNDPGSLGWTDDGNGFWSWSGDGDGSDCAGMVVSATEPADPIEGMQWLNSNTAEVFIFDGAVWLEFPAGSSGSGGGLWEQNGDDISYDKGNVSVSGTVTAGGANGAALGSFGVWRQNNSGLVFTSGSVRPATGAGTGDNSGTLSLGEAGYKFKEGHFAGDVRSDSRFVVSGGGNLRKHDDFGGLSIHGSGGVAISTNANAQDRLTIDAAGNVGIGEEAPLNQLHITAQNANYSTMRLDATANTIPANYGFRAHDGVLDIRNFTDNTTPLTISGDGNVGINTTTIQSKLHIDDATVNSSTDAPMISFSSGRPGSRYSAIGQVRGSSSNQVGLSFYTTNNLDTPTEKMRIDANGDTTFTGTVSGGGSEGQTLGSGRLRLNRATTNYITAESPAAEFNFQIGGTETDKNVLRMQANGNATFSGIVSAKGGKLDLTDSAEPGLSASIVNTGTYGSNGAYPAPLKSSGQLQYNAESHLFADTSVVLGGYPVAWAKIDAGFTWGSYSDTLMTLTSAGNAAFSGSVSDNQGPLMSKRGLIKTLSTLRKATMDETQDIRESLRSAIDELISGFEQEIATMPAPEPEVSTMPAGDSE